MNSMDLLENDLMDLRSRILEYAGCPYREEYSDKAFECIVTIFVSALLEKMYHYQLQEIDEDKRTAHQLYWLEELRMFFKKATGIDLWEYYENE